MKNRTEGRHAGEFLLSEANGTRSREEIIVVATAAALPSGQLLGKLTATGEYAPYNPVAEPADGSETVAAVLWAPVAASESAQRTVGIVRDAEVIERLITGLDASGKADLLNRGIVVRP